MTTPHAVPLEPTPIHVSDEVLDDRRARLALTRSPLDEGKEDWSYGVPDSYPDIVMQRSAPIARPSDIGTPNHFHVACASLAARLFW
jgi:hypothetical protein